MSNNVTGYYNLQVTGAFSINGDNSFCATSNNYSISNLPTGATVVWQSSNQNIATPNTPTASQTSLTKVNEGTITLTATISNVCGGPYVITKENIAIGAPNFSVSINGTSEAQPNGGYYFSLEFTPWNTMVSNISWTVPSGWTLYSGQGNMQVTIYAGTTAGYVEATFDDACGISHYVNKYVTIGGGGDDPLFVCCGGGEESKIISGINIFPNPAYNVITVSLTGVTARISSNFIRQIKITNKMGLIMSNSMFRDKSKSRQINISSLPPDVYTMQVYNNKTWKTIKFIKK